MPTMLRMMQQQMTMNTMLVATLQNLVPSLNQPRGPLPLTGPVAHVQGPIPDA